MLGLDHKVARFTWTCGVTLTSMYCLYLARKTVLLFVIAVLFAYLLFPLVAAIQRHLRVKNPALAAALVFAFLLSLLASFTWFMGPGLRAEARQLTLEVERPGFRERLKSWKPFDLPVGEEIAGGENQLANFLPQLSRTVRAAVRDTTNLFLVPILAFFFLKDGDNIRSGVVDLIFRGAQDQEEIRKKRVFVENILADAHSMILQYMRALLYLCIATQISYTVALDLMHVRYAILLALIAFPLEFVPLVGPLTSALIIIGVSMFNHYAHIVWIVVFLIVYRIFQDYVLSPYLMRNGVKLHPLLVMFGVFAGGEIGGIGGIFLSIPLLALARLVYYEWCKGRAKPTKYKERPSTHTTVEIKDGAVHSLPKS